MEADERGKSKNLGTREIRFFLAMFMNKSKRVYRFVYAGINIFILRSRLSFLLSFMS